MGIHNTFPLNELAIKEDTGINLLIDMSHKCDFFTLWQLGRPLKKSHL